MFVLGLLQDTVAINPHEQHLAIEEIVRKRLNDRLANKVIPNLGLCICVYDLQEISDIYILPGDGRGHTRVKFRLVVFRPHVDEVIQARIVGSAREGLTLSVEFFEDIFIPAEKLPDPHQFEEKEQIWYWDYTTEDGETAKLYMDPGKTVRFRVKENVFKDVKPELTPEEAAKEKSYEIIGTMTEQGLGCTAWWDQDDMEE